MTCPVVIHVTETQRAQMEARARLEGYPSFSAWARTMLCALADVADALESEPATSEEVMA